MFNKWKPEENWIIWSPFIIGAAYNSLSPIIPLLRDALEIDSTIIGVTISISAFFALLITSTLGYYSDLIGKTKLMTLAALFTALGALIIANSISSIHFRFGYCIFFLGLSLMSVMMMAGVADLSIDSRALLLTKSALIWNLGAMVCCLLIGFIMGICESWRILFLMFFILFSFTSIIFLVSQPAKFIYKNMAIRTEIQRIATVKRIFLIAICIFFLEGAITFNTWVTTYLTSESNISMKSSIFVMGAFWLMFAFGISYKRYLIRIISEKNIVLITTTIMLIWLLLFFLTDSIWIKALSTLMIALSYATNPVLLTSLAIDNSPNDSGKIAGILHCATILSSVVFQPVSGMIIDWFGARFGVLVPIICVIFALIFSFRLH